MRTLLENLREDQRANALGGVKCGGRYIANDIGQAIAEIVALQSKVADLLEAAQLLEAAELGRDDDCEECSGEGLPEACGRCSPPFDDARVKRRLAIAKAKSVSQ